MDGWMDRWMDGSYQTVRLRSLFNRHIPYTGEYFKIKILILHHLISEKLFIVPPFFLLCGTFKIITLITR